MYFLKNDKSYLIGCNPGNIDIVSSAINATLSGAPAANTATKWKEIFIKYPTQPLWQKKVNNCQAHLLNS